MQLACKQWQHGMDAMPFTFDLAIDRAKLAVAGEDAETMAIDGMVECRVHAENLSDAFVMRCHVKIDVVRKSPYYFVSKLIEGAVSRSVLMGRPFPPFLNEAGEEGA